MQSFLIPGTGKYFKTVEAICKKVNDQFSVMTRFGKLVSTEKILHLCKAFVLTHFYYCSIYDVAFL